MKSAMPVIVDDKMMFRSDRQGLRCGLFQVGLMLICLGLLAGPTYAQQVAAYVPGEYGPIDLLHEDDIAAINAMPDEYEVPDGLYELWAQALAREDVPLKIEALSAFERAAQLGMDGVESYEAPIAEALDHSSRLVRTAAAKTLIAMQATQHSQALLDLADQSTIELTQSVDQALASWTPVPDWAMTQWQTRALDSTATAELRVSALQSLYAVKLSQDSNSELLDRRAVFAVVEDVNVSWSVRQAAAELLTVLPGMIDVFWIESLVPGHDAERLLAATLLANRSAENAKAERALLTLLGDSNPSIAAMSAKSLVTLPTSTELQKERLLNHELPAVRVIGVEALAESSSIQAIEWITPLLGDGHVLVRREVTKQLSAISQSPEAVQSVNESVDWALSHNTWQSLEQAAILVGLANLQDRAAAMIPLLTHDRAEVRLAAAWALRKTLVPSTFPAIAQRAEDLVFEQSATADIEATQINIALGLSGYRESTEVLRGYLGKSKSLSESRAAAVWALGKLYENDPVAGQSIAGTLAMVVTDRDQFNPELLPVRIQAAVTLGRILQEDAKPLLMPVIDFPNDPVQLRLTAGRIIAQTTGDDSLIPQTPLRTEDWFLEPIQTQP